MAVVLLASFGIFADPSVQTQVALAMTHTPRNSGQGSLPLSTDIRLMPRLSLVIGAIVFATSMAVGISAAPKEHIVLTSVVLLLVAVLLGAGTVYFLRLRCRFEVPSPYRTLHWWIGKEHQQLLLDQIARVTIRLDQNSDEPAYHVVFELKHCRYVPLTSYSWGTRHADRLCRQIRQFLETVDAREVGLRQAESPP
jgi:hypothetical protein